MEAATLGAPVGANIVISLNLTVPLADFSRDFPCKRSSANERKREQREIGEKMPREVSKVNISHIFYLRELGYYYS